MQRLPEAVFGVISDAVICENGGKITYMNPPAERFLPGIKPGDGLNAVFPAEFTSGEGEYAFTALLGVEVCVSVCPMEEGRAFVFSAPSDGELKEFCSRLGKSLRESASVFQMSYGLITPRLEELGDGQLENYAAMAEHSCYSVLRTAANVSFLGEVKDGDGSCRRVAFDAVALCGELCNSVSRIMGKGSARLIFEAGAASIPVNGDERLIEAAVLNLLSNSFKYTPKDGEIRLSVKKKGSRVILCVSDTGRGIPPEVMGTVFSRYGEKSGLNDAKDGLGLGIAVVRRVAVLHGGSVIIGNGKDGGASVSLLLPAADPTERFSSDTVPYEGGMQPLLTILADVLPTECYKSKYLE